MINKDKVLAVVKEQLPQAEDTVIENIAQDVIRDGEAVLRSIIRQAVAQERGNLYKKNSRE